MSVAKKDIVTIFGPESQVHIAAAMVLVSIVISWCLGLELCVPHN
jgi:hypothetical protein